MSEWSFLVSRRWAGYLALVVVFAIACCALGTWQLNRRAEALAEVARIDANYDHAPIAVERALPDPAAFDVDDKWLPVELRGRYLVDEQVAVRNRPLGGSTGYEIVTPFRLDDGRVFFVDRGWVARSDDGTLGEVAPPPGGELTVAARLKADEGTISGRTSTEDTIGTVDLAELAERVGAPAYTGAYGLLVQEGADAAEPPLPSPRPERDEGPHLSYAFQWFVFALMAFVALGWIANQERRNRLEAAAEAEADGDGVGGGPGSAPRPADPLEGRGRSRAVRPEPRRRVRASPSDADVEDEILDRR